MFAEDALTSTHLFDWTFRFWGPEPIATSSGTRVVLGSLGVFDKRSDLELD